MTWAWRVCLSSEERRRPNGRRSFPHFRTSVRQSLDAPRSVRRNIVTSCWWPLWSSGSHACGLPAKRARNQWLIVSRTPVAVRAVEVVAAGCALSDADESEADDAQPEVRTKAATQSSKH